MVTKSSLQTVLALSLLAATATAQAPANDDCSTAAVAVEGLNPFDSTSATDGSGLPLDPMVCDFATFGDEQIYQDVWFSFTPAMSNPYDISVQNAGNPSFDGRLAIYNQSTCPDDPALVIACDEDQVTGTNPQPGVFGLPLTGATTYLIRVGSYGPFTAEQPAELNIFTPPPPPANDDCVGAIAVSPGLTAFDSTWATDGTGLALDPSVCSFGFTDEQLYQDVWFSFTPTMTDFYDIASVNNGNTPFDSRIAVYDQSTCPDDPANVIACDDDSFSIALEAQVTSVGLTSGSTYLIRVGSFDDAVTEQPAALSISVGIAPPANDNCVDAEVIPPGFSSTPYDNTLATTDGSSLLGNCLMNPLDADGQVWLDLWFTYTPSASGCYYISNLNQSGIDTRMAIYSTTTCPEDPATVIACSDDEVQPIAFPFEAGMDVTLTGGQTYLIRFGNYDDGFFTAPGPGNLVIGAGPQAVNNDSGLQPGAPGCTPGPTFPDSCSGDGGDQMGCSDCPCGNNALAGTVGGCTNSAGTSTRLMADGDPSVSLPSGSTTDLVFTASGAPPSSTNVLLSGNAVAPQNMASPCFGLDSGALAGDRDGLRCAVQAVARHGNRSANGMGQIMDPTGPSRVWGGEAQPVDGIAVQSGFMAGQTRYFQITHRDDAMAVCMRGLNTSQAVEVLFTP